MKAQRARRQQRQRLLTILIVAGIALVVAGLLIYPNLRPAGEFVRVTPAARPNADFNTMGDPDAPVKMVEYSDFQCPFCKRFADETEQQIVDAYVATGKVHFTYVPYGPAGSWIGPESQSSAKAAYCAGDQGKFWEFKEYLFANHTGENVGDFTDKRLEAFANALGLNMNDFRSCFNSNKYDDRLQQGLSDGRTLGIGGTPSFTINGKIITGAQPFSEFQREIEAALAAAGTSQ
jgi:protein-disulfide isomerase